jgi:hypothetical protein
MEITDSGEFGRRLLALAELFDATLTPVKVALYFEGLRDLPFERVAFALNTAVKTATFFPRPAELRKWAVGDAEDAAEAAWMQLRGAMHTAGGYASLVADATLGETITAVFGGWPAACALELSPEMWAAKRKEFGRVFRVITQRALDGSRYLPGICEQQNHGRADWMRYVPVFRLAATVQQLTEGEAEQARTTLAAVQSCFSRLGMIDIQRAVPPQNEESA